MQDEGRVSSLSTPFLLRCWAQKDAQTALAAAVIALLHRPLLADWAWKREQSQAAATETPSKNRRIIFCSLKKMRDLFGFWWSEKKKMAEGGMKVSKHWQRTLVAFLISQFNGLFV